MHAVSFYHDGTTVSQDRSRRSSLSFPQPGTAHGFCSNGWQASHTVWVLHRIYDVLEYTAFQDFFTVVAIEFSCIQYCRSPGPPTTILAFWNGLFRSPLFRSLHILLFSCIGQRQFAVQFQGKWFIWWRLNHLNLFCVWSFFQLTADGLFKNEEAS